MLLMSVRSWHRVFTKVILSQLAYLVAYMYVDWTQILSA